MIGIIINKIGNTITERAKLTADPITTVFAISLNAGIFPKFTPATPTAVVRLVRKTGVILIFKLSVIASFLFLPSLRFVSAMDKI